MGMDYNNNNQEEEEVVEQPIDRVRLVGLGLRPDAKYDSINVSKFINIIMLDGKKQAATRVMYDALDILADKVKDKSPIEVFEESIENIKPMVEVRSKRVGGATYQIPMEVKPKRQRILAMRWIKEAFRKKKGRASAERLAAEFLDGYNKQGAAMNVRENVHKMAEANKAFAYYA
jgi:small subunit ribosomal protein S7